MTDPIHTIVADARRSRAAQSRLIAAEASAGLVVMLFIAWLMWAMPRTGDTDLVISEANPVTATPSMAMPSQQASSLTRRDTTAPDATRAISGSNTQVQLAHESAPTF